MAPNRAPEAAVRQARAISDSVARPLQAGCSRSHRIDLRQLSGSGACGNARQLAGWLASALTAPAIARWI